MDRSEKNNGTSAEEMYRALVDASPDPMAMVSLDGLLLLVNRHGAAVMGFESPEAMAGLSIFEIIHPSDLPETREKLESLVKYGGSLQRRISIPRPSGQFLEIEIKTSLVRDAQGQPFALAIVGRDVGQRLEMETKLAQSNRLASMGFLAAGLAHEINNPLTSILVNLKRLADQLLRAASESRYCRTALVDLVGEEEAKKFHEGLTALAPETLDELADMARIALESGQHVQRIADDLRSVAGTEEDTRVMLQLNDVLGKAMRMSSHEIRERAEPVESYGDLPLIMGNEGRLCQLFLNLLANAVQAIEPGEETTNRIEVRTVRQDREVLVEIVDTGQGIPPRDLERIFDPFFTTKPAGVGCGMGLSICHNIAQTHGGWIQVQSAVGQGSTFAVHLPLPEPVSVPDQRKPIAAKPTQ